MAIAADHGYAVLTKNEDGTTTVRICSAIQRERPIDVYATHVRAAKVWIDPRVRLVTTSTYRYTATSVNVSRSCSPVTIRPRLQSLPEPR